MIMQTDLFDMPAPKAATPRSLIDAGATVAFGVSGGKDTNN